MGAYPLDHFEENLLPDYPGYHVTVDGRIFSSHGQGKPLWREIYKQKLKSGSIRVNLRPEKEMVSKSCAFLVAKAHLSNFRGDLPIFFKDLNEGNFHINNLYQTLDPLSHERPLEDLTENLLPEMPGYHITSDGELFSKRNKNGIGEAPYWRRVKGYITKYNYNTYRVAVLNSKSKTKFAHVLVAKAYIGEKPKGLHVCHNDGNKLNNQVSNLRYDTPKANSQDMVKHNTRGMGETSKTSILKEKEVIEIFLLAAQNKSHQEISNKFKVTTHTVRSILYRTNWKHLKIPQDIIDKIKSRRKSRRQNRFSKTETEPSIRPFSETFKD